MKKLARIEKTFLGFEDHGIFTCVLTVAYEDSGTMQGVGGHVLDSPILDEDGKAVIGRVGTKEGAQFVMNVLAVCGCTWEQLVGKGIFVLFDDDDEQRPIGIESLAFGTQKKKSFLFSDVFDNKESNSQN